MVVPRQGRREPQCFSALGRLRTRPRGEQRGPAAQTVFRQTLLVGLVQTRLLPTVRLQCDDMRGGAFLGAAVLAGATVVALTACGGGSKGSSSSSAADSAGGKIFASAGCAGCHTLS